MRVNEFDEAQLRHEFRQTIKDVGPVAAWQILYELLFATNIFLEVMQEETREL